ncbi:MAG: sialidase family protein [Bacteroidota bacterium]
MRVLPILALAALAACADAPAGPASGPGGLPAADNAAGLALAVTEAGEVVAYVDSTSRLVVRAGDGPEAIVADGAVGSNPQAGPRLAVTSDGGLVVAYVVQQTVPGRRFPASELRVARSDDGGRTFAEAVRPHPDPGFPSGHTFHSLATGPGGTVYVAWLDGVERDRYRRQQAAARLGEPAPARPEADGPPMHLAHEGEDHSGSGPEPGTQLVVARSTDGGRTFEAPVVVADGTCQCCRTDLHVADDGAVYVAWRHIFEDGARDMAIARSDDGGATFGAPAVVHADGWAIDGCPHAGPAVTTDAEGAVHVAWSTGLADRMGLWHAASADRGATFGVPSALAAPAPLGQVRAARNADGRALFAFEDRGRIGVVAAGATDTLRVDGAEADLAVGPDGPRLLWRGAERVRLGPAL